MVRIVLALAFASLCGASCVSNKPNECDGTNCIGKKNPCIVPTNVRTTRRERGPGISVKPAGCWCKLNVNSLSRHELQEPHARAKTRTLHIQSHLRVLALALHAAPVSFTTHFTNDPLRPLPHPPLPSLGPGDGWDIRLQQSVGYRRLSWGHDQARHGRH